MLLLLCCCSRTKMNLMFCAEKKKEFPIEIKAFFSLRAIHFSSLHLSLSHSFFQHKSVCSFCVMLLYATIATICLLRKRTEMMAALEPVWQDQQDNFVQYKHSSLQNILFKMDFSFTYLKNVAIVNFYIEHK